MIISCSRRTDIPAFYAPWLLKRLIEGFCHVVNPMNSKQVSRVSLDPHDVDFIVFWTKNPRPLISRLKEVDDLGHRYYFQYTINGYGPPLEAHCPGLDASIDTFTCLSSLVGPRAVVWRYDPIVLSDVHDDHYHVERFSEIAQRLRGATTRVVISILDVYAKTRRNIASMSQPNVKLVEPQRSYPRLGALMAALASVAAQNNMEIVSCAEDMDFREHGVRPGKCIDDGLARELFGSSALPPKDHGQRPACRCVKSRDIGAYDTCLHDCRYCYANRSDADATRMHGRHQEDSPSLIGWHQPVIVACP